MQNYICGGEVFQYPVPASTTINAGDAVLMGSVVGIAHGKGIGDNGDVIRVAAEGVYTVVKATGAVWTIGEKIYWDDTAKKFTPTATSNTLAGYAYTAQASGDTTGQLKLLQS